MRNGHASKFRNGINHKRRSPQCGGRIDFIRTVPFDVHIRIALDGNESNRFLPRINASQNHRVASIGVAVLSAFNALFRAVNAQDEHIKRLSRNRLFSGKRVGQLFRHIRMQLVGNAVHVDNAAKGNATRYKQQSHDHRACNERFFSFFGLFGNVGVPAIGLSGRIGRRRNHRITHARSGTTRQSRTLGHESRRILLIGGILSFFHEKHYALRHTLCNEVGKLFGEMPIFRTFRMTSLRHYCPKK